MDVTGVGVRKASNYDEGDDEHVDEGHDPVNVGRSFCTPYRNNTCHAKDLLRYIDPFNNKLPGMMRGRLAKLHMSEASAVALLDYRLVRVP